MKRLLNILLIVSLLAVSAAVVQAQAPQPHVFVPLHWIVGEVTAPQDTPDGFLVDGHQVVFYRDGEQAVLENQLTAIVENGKYILNTYTNRNLDIIYYEGIYYIAIRKGPFGYGSAPQPVTLTPGKGYEEVDLSLAYEQGLPGRGNLEAHVWNWLEDQITPQPAATVRLDELSAVTNEDGMCLLEGIIAGEYLVTAEAQDLAPTEVTGVAILENQVTVLDIYMVASQAGEGALLVKVIDNSTGVPLAGASVNVEGLASPGQTNSNGVVLFNLAADTYNISVSRDGYESAALSGIAVQEGITSQVIVGLAESGVPVDTVPLSISRSGANIEISWQVEAVPDIYVLTGEGTGVYANTAADWVPVTESGSLVESLPGEIGLFDLLAGDNKLIHQSQVGSGFGEVYYKALAPGADKVQYLADAPAVGKVNVELAVGWNLVSTPLFKANGSMNETLGTDVFVNNDQVLVWSPSQQKFLLPAANFNEGDWQNSVGLKFGRGYGFNIVESVVRTNPFTLTIIGAVSAQDFSSQIVTNWNQIGYPFPVPATLNTNLNFTANANDQLLEWDLLNQKFKLPASNFDGSIWSLDTQLKPGIGYGYNRVGDDATWDVPKQ